jgi:hypothetical protein
VSLRYSPAWDIARAGAWFAASLLAALVNVPLARSESDAEVPARPVTAAERDHWAYRPLTEKSLGDVVDARFGGHAVDRFVKVALDRRSAEPLPRAGRATRLRRVSFDLTGLPPSPEELAAFMADDAPDAYTRQVERLLASPAYGRRWAQHWLDLARFAETDGFEHDLVRPNAWRYRDWVIEALNDDMPFDEFLRLQLAGDELHPDDPRAAVATGFLLCGPDMPDLNLQEERRHVVLNEMTATVGSVFLGLQFGCAQCHDHKYDPIGQRDFYRLRAFFESADIFRDHPIPTAGELAARRAAEAAADPRDEQRRQRRQAIEELGRERFREKNPDERPNLKQVLAELSADERQEYDLALAQSGTDKLPELPAGRVVRDGPPRRAHFYARGDFRQPGAVVSCGFPEVLDPAALPVDSSQPPRARLAGWLLSAGNSLVPRVIVNRIWQWHFGVGLAASASDFGVMGAEPTHPELLDWLALRLMREHGSLKQLHRLLVTSETYQMASSPFDQEWNEAESRRARTIWQRSAAIDPENTSLWRRRRTRLDAESLRDAMLSVCGQLSGRTGGPGIRPPLAPEVTATLLAGQWNVNGDEEDHRRASIYLFVRRNLRYPMFDVFDRPDTNASCPSRHESTTATQSLVLFNSEFSLECARHLAAVVLHEAGEDPAAEVEMAYRRALSRRPTADETRLGREFLEHQRRQVHQECRAELDSREAARQALVDFCLALFNANEFVYVD